MFGVRDDEDRQRPNLRAAMLLLLLALLLLSGYILFRWYTDYRDLVEDIAARPNVTEEHAPEIADRPDPTDQRVTEEPARAPSFDGTHVRISPDGSRIAFLRGEAYRKDIWIAPREDWTSARPLGLADRQGIVQFTWAFDGRHILYRGFSDILTQAYVVDVGTGNSRALNPFDNMAAENISLSPWHPQEFLIRIGPPQEIGRDLYRGNMTTGALWQVEQHGPVTEYFSDQDFLVRAGRSLDRNGFTLFARRGEGWEDILRVARELGAQTGVLFLGAGHDLIYILDDERRDHIALSSIDLATGERFVIAARDDADITRVLTNPATSEIIAYQTSGDRMAWHALDLTYAEDLERLNAIAEGPADVVSQSLDNSLWIIESGDGFALYDRASGIARRIE